MEQLIINEKAINIKIEKQVKVRDVLVDIPVKYKGKAINTLFPISTKKAIEIINCPGVYPIEIYPGRCLLSITFFDYSWTPVGPYNELAYSIPVLYNSKFNIPLIPLLIYDFLRNFGFFVVNLIQNTEIAIEHGNLITGYPHYPKIINLKFKSDKEKKYLYADENKKQILQFEFKNPNTQKLKNKSYTTYFINDNKLFTIKMDTYTIMGNSKVEYFKLGNHELAEFLKRLDISHNSIQTLYFSEAVEILNSPVLLKNL